MALPLDEYNGIDGVYDGPAAASGTVIPTAAPPAVVSKPGWESIDQYAKARGLKVGAPTNTQTIGGVHIDGSLHSQGRARDYGSDSDTPGIVSALEHLAEGPDSPIEELFYSPSGTFFRNGVRFTGTGDLRVEHFKHAHVGLRTDVDLYAVTASERGGGSVTGTVNTGSANSPTSTTVVRSVDYDPFAQGHSTNSEGIRARTNPRFSGSGGSSPPDGATSNTPGFRTDPVLGPNQPVIHRGYMQPYDFRSPGRNVRLAFQYNPNELNQVIETNMNLEAPIDAQPTGQEEITTRGMSSFSFAVMFDRQLEVAQWGDQANATEKAKGVLVDIDWLYRVTKTAFGVQLAQPMVDVIFGPHLMVRGWIVNTEVNYSKFNHQMVPVLCTVRLSMLISYFASATTTLLPQPNEQQSALLGVSADNPGESATYTDQAEGTTVSPIPPNTGITSSGPGTSIRWG